MSYSCAMARMSSPALASTVLIRLPSESLNWTLMLAIRRARKKVSRIEGKVRGQKEGTGPQARWTDGEVSIVGDEYEGHGKYRRPGTYPVPGCGRDIPPCRDAVIRKIRTQCKERSGSFKPGDECRALFCARLFHSADLLLYIRFPERMHRICDDAFVS